MSEKVEQTIDTYPKASVIGIFTQPKEQFQRIKQHPSMLIALIVALVLAVMNGFLGILFVEDLIAEELAILGESEGALLVTFNKVVTVLAGTVAPFFVMLVKALVLLVIARIFRSSIGFTKLFTMCLYIALIALVGGIVNSLLMVVLNADPFIGTVTNLQYVLGAGGVFGQILSNVDLFSMWTLILTAFGMQIVIGISKKASWILVGAYFVIISFLTVGSYMLLESLEKFL